MAPLSRPFAFPKPDSSFAQAAVCPQAPASGDCARQILTFDFSTSGTYHVRRKPNPQPRFFVHSLIHSRTHSLTHSLTHSRTHLLTHFIRYLCEGAARSSQATAIQGFTATYAIAAARGM